MTTPPTSLATSSDAERLLFEATMAKRSPGCDFSRFNKDNYTNRAVHNAWDGWQARAALSSPANTGEGEPTIFIDFKQATDLLAMFGGEPTQITLRIVTGHSGRGLYAHYTDYPEEGAEFLGVTDEEAMPDAAPEQAGAWDANQIKQPGWHHVGQAFIDGAREARVTPDAGDDDFKRAADGYSKRMFEEVDPESERRLRTGDFSAAPGAAIAAREQEDWKPVTIERHKQAFAAGDLMAVAEEAGGARMAENVVQVTRDDIERIVYFVKEAEASRQEALAASGEPKRIDHEQFVSIASKHLPGDMDPHNAWLFFQEATRTLLGGDVV